MTWHAAKVRLDRFRRANDPEADYYEKALVEVQKAEAAENALSDL